MATKIIPTELTEHSKRHEIVEELERINWAAKNLPTGCPAYDLAHRRINELLDWLIGR